MHLAGAGGKSSPRVSGLRAVARFTSALVAGNVQYSILKPSRIVGVGLGPALYARVFGQNAAVVRIALGTYLLACLHGNPKAQGVDVAAAITVVRTGTAAWCRAGTAWRRGGGRAAA